jgi:hypothetical protein
MAKAKEEVPMNTIATTTNVTPSTPNPKQPQQRQTAKEVIAANVKELIAQLEAGHSNALTAYLDAMSRFHNYSFGNVLEIARQRPDATRVAGLYAWNQLGGKVRKGEKGTRANVFRMRQFYETYRSEEKVAPLARQLPRTHNMVILGQSKRPEETRVLS